MLRSLLALSFLVATTASLSAQQNFPVVMTTDWSITFNGQMPPCSVTSGAIGGTNFAFCSITNNLTTANSSAVGTAPTAPASAGAISCVAGRQIQALRNFGTGSARVVASSTSSAFRVQFGPGAGAIRSNAAFTTSVSGGNVTGGVVINWASPTLFTVPQSVDVTDTGVSSFLYQTLQTSSANLALSVGGGARWNATASTTAAGYLN